MQATETTKKGQSRFQATEITTEESDAKGPTQWCDPDLQIRRGGSGHPNPKIMGGGLKKSAPPLTLGSE